MVATDIIVIGWNCSVKLILLNIWYRVSMEILYSFPISSQSHKKQGRQTNLVSDWIIPEKNSLLNCRWAIQEINIFFRNQFLRIPNIFNLCDFSHNFIWYILLLKYMRLRTHLIFIQPQKFVVILWHDAVHVCIQVGVRLITLVRLNILGHW